MSIKLAFELADEPITSGVDAPGSSTDADVVVRDIVSVAYGDNVSGVWHAIGYDSDSDPQVPQNK